MSIRISRPSQASAYPGLATWRAAYGRRRSSIVNIVSVGSSSVYGSGATTLADRFVDRQANILAAASMTTAGRHALAGSTTLDGWTESGTVTGDTRGLGLATRHLAAGATLSRTDVCTGWDIHFAQGPGAGAFTVVVDGGAPTTVTPDVSGTAERHDGVYSTGALASASHTLLITATGAVAINGAYICAGDNTTGVRSWCSGKGGTVAADWANADQSLYHRIGSLRPALVQILLGPNDYGASVTPASFTASVTTVLNRIRAACSPQPSVLLIGTFRRLDTITPTYSWSAYTGALASVAAANSSWCSYIDISPDFPASKAENAALGLVSTADYLHQTSAGHQATAERIVSGALLTPAPAVVVREPFGPQQVPGLLADFSAQDLVASLVDGDAVSSWTPTWGLERAPLAQATAGQRPSLAAAAINGLAAVRFTSASSQALDTGLWTATRGTASGGKSVLVVVRPTGTLASGQTVYTGTNAASTIYAKMQYTSATIASFACGGDADTAIQYTTAVDTWCGQMAIYNGASSTISRLPGTSSDRSGTTGTGATAGMAGLRLGGNIAGSGGYISMDLARICVWDQALTTDQISRLLEWVSTTYAISLT
jgi:hypothetical protein